MSEPGEPHFFTMKGVLYRSIDGKPPEPFWVEGMPAAVKYSVEPPTKEEKPAKASKEDLTTK